MLADKVYFNPLHGLLVVVSGGSLSYNPNLYSESHKISDTGGGENLNSTFPT